jgi:hypothetical protein
MLFCEARAGMVQRVATVAFEGIEARAVDVQVQVAPGLPAFNVVGLPDKDAAGHIGTLATRLRDAMQAVDEAIGMLAPLVVCNLEDVYFPDCD